VQAGDIAHYARLGFNRASLGVQDFDPAVQRAVNRVQSVEETLRVIDACRAEGFLSVNVDLIYGLPQQTIEGFARSLDTVLASRPDRLAVYSYAHLPAMFKAQRQIADAELLGDADGGRSRSSAARKGRGAEGQGTPAQERPSGKLRTRYPILAHGTSLQARSDRSRESCALAFKVNRNYR